MKTRRQAIIRVNSRINKKHHIFNFSHRIHFNAWEAQFTRKLARNRTGEQLNAPYVNLIQLIIQVLRRVLRQLTFLRKDFRINPGWARWSTNVLNQPALYQIWLIKKTYRWVSWGTLQILNAGLVQLKLLQVNTRDQQCSHLTCNYPSKRKLSLAWRLFSNCKSLVKDPITALPAQLRSHSLTW